MPDLLATFKQLFGRSAKPENPPDLASIAAVRASADSRVTDLLGPEKLAHILRSAREGEITAYLELAEAMEERDLHYYSLLQTRKLGVTGAPWIVEGLKGKDGKPDPIAAALQREVIDTPAFRFWVADALDALGKGFAVSQPVWDTSGPRWQYREFRRQDPRVFKFAQPDLTTLMLRDASATGGLRDLPQDLIVHYPRLRAGVPIRGGLAMLAAVTWMFKNFTVKDWMAFTEVYGMPLKIAKYVAGSTSEDEKASLRRALSNIGHDAAMLIPDSVEVEVVNGRAGTSPYLELAEYFDKQLSKGVLGQTMTSDDGASLAQSKTHEKVRQDYAQADAYNLAATAHTAIFTPWVKLNFGLDAEVPWAYPDVEPEEDLKAWSDAVTPLILAGLKVPAKHAREKLGIPEPEDGEEVIEKPEPAPAPGLPGAPGKPGAAKPKPKVAPNAAEPLSVAAADDLVSGVLMDWEPVLVEYKDTLEAMAAKAKTYDEFLALLEEFSKRADSNPFVRDLAAEATKARLLAAHPPKGEA